MKIELKYFFVGTISAFIVASTSVAQGFQRFLPASNCQYQTDFIGDYIMGSDQQLSNNSNGVGSRPRVVNCPLVTDTDIRALSGTNAITSAFADVNDGSNAAEIQAQYCVSSFTASAMGTCGTAISTGTTFFGDSGMNLPLVTLTNGAYAYIVVELPTSNAGFLRGVSYSN